MMSMTQSPGYRPVSREEVEEAVRQIADRATADKFRAILAVNPLRSETENRVAGRHRMADLSILNNRTVT